MEEYKSILEDSISDIARGYAKPWYMTMQFILSADSKEELGDLIKYFKKEMRARRYRLNDLFYSQQEAFSSLFSLNVNTRRKILTPHETNNNVLAALYPFASNGLFDSRGVYLGDEVYSADPFYFDPKTKESGMRNSNVIAVAGMVGAGKTYTVSKILNWLKCTNTKQFIIDPLGDYHGFAMNYYKSRVIDMSSGKEGLINPLQVFSDQKSLKQSTMDFIG
ncbi:VirB4 component of type IV secretory pathway [Bacteroidales bacterium Barb4]|nr:VirB4 component of type IV secretory pathway [Bacteroidales bacterium Barb4]